MTHGSAYIVGVPFYQHNCRFLHPRRTQIIFSYFTIYSVGVDVGTAHARNPWICGEMELFSFSAISRHFQSVSTWALLLTTPTGPAVDCPFHAKSRWGRHGHGSRHPYPQKLGKHYFTRIRCGANLDITLIISIIVSGECYFTRIYIGHGVGNTSITLIISIILSGE